MKEQVLAARLCHAHAAAFYSSPSPASLISNMLPIRPHTATTISSTASATAAHFPAKHSHELPRQASASLTTLAKIVTAPAPVHLAGTTEEVEDEHGKEGRKTGRGRDVSRMVWGCKRKRRRASLVVK